MIFLNEKILALLFGVLCFVVSCVVGILQENWLWTVIVRALIFSILAYFIGFAFGSVIKEIFLETIAEEQKKEEAKIREIQAKQLEEEHRAREEMLRASKKST